VENRTNRGVAAFNRAMILLVVFLLFCFPLIASAKNVAVGVKIGDWKRTSYTYSGSPPSDYLRFVWVKLEVLNVTGALVTARLTAHFLNGTEANETVDFIVGSIMQSEIIPANSTIGDAVLVPGSGAFISEESVRTYCGASRPVLMAARSDNVTFWDKQTGIVVELSEHGDGYTVDVVVTETNMWSSTGFLGLDWWLWVIIVCAVVAAVASAVVLLLLARRKSTSIARAESQKKGIVTNCYSKIVTKVLAFPQIRFLRSQSRSH
jgi:hypothetical protein